MNSTNNFSAQTPCKSSRSLYCGAFQPVLESALAEAVGAYKQTHGPLAPLHILVPTRLLGLHLQRALARQLGGHCNLRFSTLTDFASDIFLRSTFIPILSGLPAPLSAEALAKAERSTLSVRLAPPLGLELLCARIARHKFTGNSYFAPVRDMKGFPAALLATFTDLKEACVLPGALAKAAKSEKLRELAAAYAEFCSWLDKHGFQTEADLLEKSRTSNPESEVFFYGFYDLNAAQKQFVQHLSPATVFFPWTEHSAAYAQPLLDWFKSLGYSIVPLHTSSSALRSSVVSCPGESSEVREAARAAHAYLYEHPDNTFNDIAILCRSREQYDTFFRDTLHHLNIPTYFRGGRPIGEHLDAKLLRLILETIRSDYSRIAIMELAGHLGHPMHQLRSEQSSERSWEAESVELGIIGGKAQWRARCHENTPLRQFVESLFAVCDAVPTKSSWQQFVDAILAAWRKLGGKHGPVQKTLQAFRELDEFEAPVEFEMFAYLCERALEDNRESSGPFQDGRVFVSDVMGARGLSFRFVAVLGLVEKSFPRAVFEDPLLLDDEREKISPNLPLKRRNYDEERLLFDLATGCACDQLVLSYPRLEPGAARPRVPSHLLLERMGAKTFKALEEQTRRVSISPVRAEPLPLEPREFDLPALCETTAEAFLAQISPLLPSGVSSARARWRNRALTAHDGLIAGREALQLLHERFVLEKLIISATSLEDFFRCPFYYFQKHVIGTKPWEEPESAITIDPAELGSLYHEILEDYYRQQPDADLDAIMEARFREFERNGVTGYTAIWELRKQIVREEVAAFVRRDKADAGQWTPAEFEREFSEIAVAPPVRLRGKIDRIDRNADGSRIRVLDYKTGRFRKGLKDDDFARGEALQLALYLLAAEKLFPGKRVESAHYLYFTLRGGYHTASFSRDALTKREEELNQLLQTAADMIRDGTFAQYAPTKNDPCRACDFHQICGNGIHKLYRLKNEDPRMASFRAIKEGES